MTREEAEHVAQATFGPRAECLRVSSGDRNNRFVIALGSYRISKNERPTPLLLGAGGDWTSALDNARNTPNGQHALAEQQKVKDIINKAMNSETPGEFTEGIRQMTLDEAKAKGASQEVIDKINQKFDAAKKKLEEDLEKKKNVNDSGKP